MLKAEFLRNYKLLAVYLEDSKLTSSQYTANYFVLLGIYRLD